MDSSHKLDAPNNDELRSIEQIEDHSGLTTLYRNPGEQFEGDILSAPERERVKAEKLAAQTNGIWKSSPKIGFLIPYPFVSGLLLAVFLYSVVNWNNAGILLGLIILSGGFWVLTSYFAYAKVFKIFYKHALRTGPFLILMLVSILAASQAIFNIVAENFAGDNLFINLLIVSGLTILYSMAATFAVLLPWGTANVKTMYKVLMGGLVVAVSGFFLAATYLF